MGGPGAPAAQFSALIGDSSFEVSPLIGQPVILLGHEAAAISQTSNGFTDRTGRIHQLFIFKPEELPGWS